MPMRKAPKKRVIRRAKKLAKDADPIQREARTRKREQISEKRNETIKRIEAELAARTEQRRVRKESILDAKRKIWNRERRDVTRSPEEEKMTQIREDMKMILTAGVESVNAFASMRNKVRFEGSSMTISGQKYNLKKNVHLVGWGRETLMLGTTFEKIIGRHLKKGFLVIPRGSLFGTWNVPLSFPKLDTRITFLEAGSGGIPDEESVAATRKIAKYCEKLKKKDILVVILSSGTRELLCYPKMNIKIEELLWGVNILKSSGATSAEVDTFLINTSAVLGGDLARIAYPAKVITLVMSDIPGDPPHLVGLSPTVNDPSKKQASSIVQKYDLSIKMPPSIMEALRKEESEHEADLLLDNDYRYFEFVDYHVIASIGDVIDGMASAAFRIGLVPVKLSPAVVGDVREISQAYCQIAALLVLAVEEKINKIEMYDAMKNNPVLCLSEDKVIEIFPVKDKWGLGLCLLMGGYAEVVVNEDGKSGPNQELALYFSLDWHMKAKQYPILKEYIVWFLGGSSNGIDGNTKFAGAYGYGNLGPAIYKRHEELTRQGREIDSKLRGLTRRNPDTEDILKVIEEHSSLRNELDKLSSILPDRVLRDNNTNHLFKNINDAEELLDLGDTYTNVRDLHVIRIVRYQCNCDGSCHQERKGVTPSRVELSNP